jgi:tRNA(Ile)-lysidine synthase
MNHRLARTRLAVRSRRPGDRLRPAGLEGEKRLQDIFVDAKVPARYREGMPLITDDKGIFWVVGQRIDERAAVLPGDRRVLHITAERTG